MPKCHYGLAIFLFLATPAFNVITYIAVVASSDVQKSAMFPFLTFYAILTVMLLIFFLVSILDVLEKVKQ